MSAVINGVFIFLTALQLAAFVVGLIRMMGGSKDCGRWLMVAAVLGVPSITYTLLEWL